MNLTKISLGLAVMLALSLAAVPTASAAQFKSSSSPVSLHGEANTTAHVFKIDGQAAECNGNFSKSSLSTPANTIPGISASYSGCKAFGFLGTLNMGGCTYEYLQPNATLNGNMAIRCGNPNNAFLITIFASAFGSECEVKIGETNNTNLSKITYANNNPFTGEVLATAAVTGLTATKTKDNGLCPLSGTGSTSAATFEGPTRWWGTLGITFSVA